MAGTQSSSRTVRTALNCGKLSVALSVCCLCAVCAALFVGKGRTSSPPRLRDGWPNAMSSLWAAQHCRATPGAMAE